MNAKENYRNDKLEAVFCTKHHTYVGNVTMRGEAINAFF
jgi:hypothetical protein